MLPKAFVLNAYIDYNAFMATLNIRNLPEKVHARLRVRAARAGRSMEAEVRAILSDVCLGDDEPLDPGALQELVDRLYEDARPSGVVEQLIRERRLEAAGE